MLTFWRQPGDKTMKRQTELGSKHVTVEEAQHEIELLKSKGHKIVNYGHKITVE